ncbi:Lysine-specific demethylase JMJ25 [Vitis vinifera]|uniref:Lysine-specific demethylase JMJ25 n=1 Tax=Vitis vinifera TaxID=29760 RepID=A0A438CYN0_VITVI|nr:Lysine-specific demethylase JMJ25 [Vitis vinifera]
MYKIFKCRRISDGLLAQAKASPAMSTTGNFYFILQVEIDIKQFFLGSLEGRKHTNAWQEKLKLKGWLSSHLFQEQFPAHYDEIIHSLPLQEYMNPKSGLLNLAVKLPHEYPKPDLGPCIYISYGSCEELLLADSVTRLSYESYDVVGLVLCSMLQFSSSL